MTTSKRGTKRTKTWSYSTGERGRNRVRVFEDYPGSVLFLAFSESEPGTGRPRKVRLSLKHRDRERAKREADASAATFAQQGGGAPRDLTLAELFDNYLGEVTPGKKPGKQGHDRRAAAMFVEAFGRRIKAHALSRREWDVFIRQRREGRISPPRSRGRPVRNRQIEYDLRFLLAVLNWATTAGDGRGGRLLERNPLKGLKVPSEESPVRVHVTPEEYDALLRVAAGVDWRFELALVLVHETGNRIGSVRRLRWSDVNLQDGQVRWRRENDKVGFERDTPLTTAAVEALRRARSHRLGLGESWVVPAPRDPSEPCRGDLMTKWWNRAVRLAGLPPKRRRGWHSLRRKFATDMKGEPTVDLLHLGGWKSPQTLLKCYQAADQDTMRTALEKRSRRAS